MKVACVNIIMKECAEEQSFAGAMVSKDPVAADCATLDFCAENQLMPPEYIQQMRRQVDAAQSLGVGTMEYKVEKVAY